MRGIPVKMPIHFTQANLMNGNALLIEFSDGTQAVLSLEQILPVAMREASLPQIGGRVSERPELES